MAAAQIIGIDSHFLASSLADALERRRELPRITDCSQGPLIEYGEGNAHPILATMGDVEVRLHDMNEQGIDVAVLGLNVPGVDWFPASDAPSVARGHR